MTTGREPQDIRELATWLQGRRWYGDKSRALAGMDRVFQARAERGALAIEVEVCRFAYADGSAADYLLVHDTSHPDADGIESDQVRSWFLDGFLSERVLDGEDGVRMRWMADQGMGKLGISENTPSRVFRGEQSNSSIVYGDKVMMKLFRKLRQGENPEVEIGEFFTQHTTFDAFPKLLGTIVLEIGDQPTTIGAAQQFIPSIGDAWSWITERLNDAEMLSTTIDAAQLLGRRTGEMHVAFASGKSDNFVPEVATGAYADAVRIECETELRDTVGQLERRGVGGVATLGSALERFLDTFLHLEGSMITRIHGDYHLGQILRTQDEDFAILDFEGEPTRPLAERRAKASPLRDVAGMLRSFDYAAETARRASGHGDVAGLDAWYQASRGAFLDGYNAVVEPNSVLMRGWSEGTRSAVLAAFEMHKALYEVRYELGNRPDWLEIPLNALRRIADQRATD